MVAMVDGLVPGGGKGFDLLDGYSVEITARQADKVASLKGRLGAGGRVYIALVARLIPSEASLRDRIARLAGEAGVTEVLAIGGGLDTRGPFPATIDMLRTGAFEGSGITRIGFAGHPEGNSDITRAHGEGALLEALLVKQDYALRQGIDAYLLTQFLFEADPVASWIRGLRAQGVVLPLYVGLPGPATIKTLAKFALLCGVGASARMIRKQALNITRLMSVSAPDAMIAALAQLQRQAPDLGIAGVHFYPFGGFDKLFDWLDKRER
jgi:methylenetetrahydrofolate reductase (NADPH)